MDVSSHAVHHLIRIASRWQSSDSWVPSLCPGHDTSGLMRRWRGESLISGPSALCLCQIRAGRGPTVPDERYEVWGHSVPKRLPLHTETLSSSSVTELTKENSTHTLFVLTSVFQLSLDTIKTLFFPTQTVCRWAHKRRNSLSQGCNLTPAASFVSRREQYGRQAP